MLFIILLSLVGIAVSIYAYMIEVNVAANPEYKPACDLSNTVSCTRVMGGPYAKLVGISNALIGVAFYSLLFVLASFSAVMIVFYLSLASVLVSIVLAYITYFKLRSICLVCTSIYIINVLLLLVSYAYFQ